MNGTALIRLVLVILVFLVWAGLAIRALLLWRQRAAEAPGGSMMQQAAAWMRNPADRPDRRTLFLFTAVLAAMIAMQALLPEG